MSYVYCRYSDISRRRRTFLRRDFAAPSRNHPPQKPGGFLPLTDALAFVPLLSSRKGQGCSINICLTEAPLRLLLDCVESNVHVGLCQLSELLYPAYARGHFILALLPHCHQEVGAAKPAAPFPVGQAMAGEKSDPSSTSLAALACEALAYAALAPT